MTHTMSLSYQIGLCSVIIYTEMGQITVTGVTTIALTQVTIAMECDQCDSIVNSTLIVVSTHAGHHSNGV